MKPRILDLFCGAGGAAVGYHRAGFDVVGVDIVPQPNYPFEFHQADAVDVLRCMEVVGESDRLGFALSCRFDAIHASPPCHDHSTLSARAGKVGTGWMLDESIRLLKEIGLPYVVENVVGPTVMTDGWWFTLCGSSFNLGVRRHRRFTSSAIVLAPSCQHDLQPDPIDVSGTGARRVGERLDGGGGNSRKPRNLEEARAAMGIDWMTRRELSQAIPPAYTEWIGAQLIREVVSRRFIGDGPIPMPVPE